MQIVGAFLAESAEIVDGKLNVVGGVLDSIEVPRAGVANDAGEQQLSTYFLVTVLQAGPDDYEPPLPLMTLEFLRDGETEPALFTEGEIQFEEAAAGENRFWITPIGLAATRSGRMILINSISGGNSVTVPVEVRLTD